MAAQQAVLLGDVLARQACFSALMHASARTVQIVQSVPMTMTQSLLYLARTRKILLLSASRRCSKFCMDTLQVFAMQPIKIMCFPFLLCVFPFPSKIVHVLPLCTIVLYQMI